jgi:hypothetical protein
MRWFHVAIDFLSVGRCWPSISHVPVAREIDTAFSTKNVKQRARDRFDVHFLRPLQEECPFFIRRSDDIIRGAFRDNRPSRERKFLAQR